MIIECQTCHARFRLDESRIKGRGARVKCRKCGDGILVLKDNVPAPAPPSTVEEGSFDLGSAVRESVGEGPASPSPPPVGNLIPFPAPPRPVETAAPEAATPGESAAAAFAPPPEKDEVDLAFDRFLSGGPEAPSPDIAEPETTVPAPSEAGGPVEADAPAAPETAAGPDLGALTLDFGPDEKLDLPPGGPPERRDEEPRPAEPASEFRGEGEILIGDSESLDFLKEERPAAESGEPHRAGDISLAISAAPVDEGISFPRELEPPPTPEIPAVPAPAEISIEGNTTPMSTPVMEVPPHREAEPPPATPAEPPARRGSAATDFPRSRSSAGPVAAAALAILIAGGVYLGFTASGRKTLQGMVPGAAALWGGKPAAPAGPKYDLRNVIGYYESGAASPRILVIKGQVANLSAVEKSGIRVHAALLDNNDAVLFQQEVYAGNVLSGEAIRKGDRDALSRTLGNRFGEGLANLQVAPGKSIPFMVVFFDAPANIDSYKLEAKDVE